LKIRSPFLTKLAARLAVFTVRMLFKTVRIEIRSYDEYTNPFTHSEGKTSYLFSVWHDQLLRPTFSATPINTSALISKHQDGSYLAETMRILKFGTIRGSSSRGAVTALKELMQTASSCQNIVITPDGPRGPRRELKQGIVYIASKTGSPVVASASACSRYWSIKASWSNLIIPKPFSRLVILGSEPLIIPPDLSKEELEEHRQRVQRRMEELEEELAGFMAGGKLTTVDSPEMDEQEGQRAA